MSFYVEEEESFVKKCNSIKEDAVKNDKITLLKFLNKRQVQLLEYVVGKNAYLYLSSFTDDDEYKRAIVSPFEIEPDFKIVIAKLDYNKRYLTPNHRMVLGALMSYGVTRESIGDIYITQNDDVFITLTKEIWPYIKDEFRILSHQGVSLILVDKIEGELKQNLSIKDYFVASMRLDLILANACNLSRKEAQEAIAEGRVKVNQKPEMNPCANLSEGDILSIKGFGKLKITEIGGLSKHNRIFIKIGKYQ